MQAPHLRLEFALHWLKTAGRLYSLSWFTLQSTPCPGLVQHPADIMQQGDPFSYCIRPEMAVPYQQLILMIILSVVVLGEHAGITQWCGGLLVIAGMVLIGRAGQAGVRKKQVRKENFI